MNWGTEGKVHSKMVVKWESDNFLPAEPVVKYTFDEPTQRWNQENVQVQLRPHPIAEGANRLVYCLRDLSLPAGQQRHVAKASKECADGRSEHFAEVVMQAKCNKFADEFNNHNPPKQIRFLRPCVIEFIQRPADRTGGPPLMLVEPMLEGVYHKHSNNWGFVDPQDRNTPQAFSHFTFNASSGQCIVVDIQGVGDCYTDPQIHSNQPPELPPVYGQGDMANCGIAKFFETHRCNVICRMLGLTGGQSTKETRKNNALKKSGNKPPPVKLAATKNAPPPVQPVAAADAPASGASGTAGGAPAVETAPIMAAAHGHGPTSTTNAASASPPQPCSPTELASPFLMGYGGTNFPGFHSTPGFLPHTSSFGLPLSSMEYAYGYRPPHEAFSYPPAMLVLC